MHIDSDVGCFVGTIPFTSESSGNKAIKAAGKGIIQRTLHNRAVMNSCGLVLLAAGSSSRLGAAKQLLPFNNKNLLQHSLDIALMSVASPVITVLGANAPDSQPGTGDERLRFVHNLRWETGIASSIHTGLSELMATHPSVSSVIFMVCDQPYVSASLLNGLIIRNYLSGKDIVASSYEDTLGTPVLFTKKYFDDLLALEGDTGAKKIIMNNMHAVAQVSFPMGHIDIDTRSDYELLNVLSSHNNN